MWATAGVTGDIIYISYIGCVTAWWQNSNKPVVFVKSVLSMEYLISATLPQLRQLALISKRPIIRSRTTFIYSYHIIYTYTTINFAGYDESIDTFITIIAQHNNCISMCSRCYGLVFYCKNLRPAWNRYGSSRRLDRNTKMDVVLTVTLGDPVKLRMAVPRFWILNVLVTNFQYWSHQNQYYRPDLV